jgi:glycolate oxidase
MNIAVQYLTHDQVFQELESICGKGNVFDDTEILFPYGSDNTMGLHFDFDILVKPASPEEISEIMAFCNAHHIVVTPRGGGTGVTGGALPVRGGVVLSLERLNKIVSLNKIDGYIEAEAGVITATLKAAVEEAGFSFPVVPTSADNSFIGGNVAENAGSMYSCRFGTTADHVLNLQVVLPTGELLWTGSNLSKNATGFNLTRLIVGSEGTLAIITKVVFRILKKPGSGMVLLVAFHKLEDAYSAIKRLKTGDVNPSAVEMVCTEALSLTRTFTRLAYPYSEGNIAAQLIIEFSEDSEPVLNQNLEFINEAFKDLTDYPILIGNTMKEKLRLSQLRMDIGLALTGDGRYYRDVDVTVPVSCLLDYIRFVKALSASSGIEIIVFGHALDGNMHTMILLNRDRAEDNQNEADAIAEEIYRYAISLGGVISGEHGIGMLQKKFMRLQYDEVHLALMRKIKDVFDPNGILNPGKIF